ncbi:MAG: hypothetical protein RL757_2148 [Bacteroidota bacterium]|jgi:hypothetical protein
MMLFVFGERFATIEIDKIDYVFSFKMKNFAIIVFVNQFTKNLRIFQIFMLPK